MNEEGTVCLPDDDDYSFSMVVHYYERGTQSHCDNTSTVYDPPEGITLTLPCGNIIGENIAL